MSDIDPVDYEKFWNMSSSDMHEQFWKIRGDDAYQALLNIPRHMRDPVLRYFFFGIAGGGFLSSVLEGNFPFALARADHKNRLVIKDYLAVLYHSLPRESWGPSGEVQDWINQHGYFGRLADQALSSLVKP